MPAYTMGARLWLAGVKLSLLLTCFIITQGTTLEGDQKVSYDGHQLVRVLPKTESEVAFVSMMEKNGHFKVQFLNPVRGVDIAIDMVVPPKMQELVHHALQGRQINYTIPIENLDKLLQSSLPTAQSSSQSSQSTGQSASQFSQSTGQSASQSSQSTGQSASQSSQSTGQSTRQSTGQSASQQTFRLDQYHTYQQITDWLHTLSEQYPSLLSVRSIGSSWENRHLYLAQISIANDEAPRDPKPAIWLDAGIHANEWIGPATMVYFIHELVTKYGYDADITWLVDHFDWNILPVFNVDGYAYSWTHDRLWRKSRSRHSTGGCVGVDINRNWDVHWGENDADKNPCGRNYIGPHPFSEPELQAAVNFLRNSSVVAYVAYHSYGQLWMSPYSWSNKHRPEHFVDQMEMSASVVSALGKVYGTEYMYGRVADMLGEASGSSIDYAYDVLNIKYSFGVELRDEGKLGVFLPPQHILPNAIESLAAVKQMAKLIRANSE